MTMIGIFLNADVIKSDSVANSQREATFKDGCLSLRKEVIDNMRARIAPGPIYNPLPHVLSKQANVRNVKFGTGPKRFEESNKINYPGPQSYDPEAIRKAIKTLKGACRGGIKFGKDERDCNRVKKNKQNQPSPAEYDPEMIRRGIAFSKLGTPAHVKFQKAACHNESKLEMGPGPQTYDPEAIRRGIILTKSKRSINLTATMKGKFTTSTSSLTKPLVATGTKLLSKETSPGPQHYDTEKIRRGILMLSNINRCPAGVKFGTVPRIADTTPVSKTISASKQVVTSVFGPQSNSRFKTQPRYSFGAR